MGIKWSKTQDVLINWDRVQDVLLVICPTMFSDFDILALGNLKLLEKIKKVEPYFHLIKQSKCGNIPILILDTTYTLRNARTILESYRKEFKAKGLL